MPPSRPRRQRASVLCRRGPAEWRGLPEAWERVPFNATLAEGVTQQRLAPIVFTSFYWSWPFGAVQWSQGCVVRQTVRRSAGGRFPRMHGEHRRGTAKSLTKMLHAPVRHTDAPSRLPLALCRLDQLPHLVRSGELHGSYTAESRCRLD